MSNFKKTWFLVPTWDMPPSAMRLGYIIADPTDPRYPINPARTASFSSPDHRDVPSIDTEIFVQISPSLSLELSSDTTCPNFGLWGNFLHFIGLDAKRRLHSSTQTVSRYAFEETRTEWFCPSLDFIWNSIKSKDVQDFISMIGLDTVLYMVVGVKVVTGASLVVSYNEGYSYAGNFGLDIPPAPLFLADTSELASAGDTGQVVETKRKEPIAFAYQLVQLKLRDAHVTAEPHTKGAMFGIGDRDRETMVDLEVSDEIHEFLTEGEIRKTGEEAIEILESFDEATNAGCSVATSKC